MALAHVLHGNTKEELLLEVSRVEAEALHQLKLARSRQVPEIALEQAA